MYKIRSHKLAVGQAGVDFVASPNAGGALDPKFLVIHFTASGPSSDIAKYFSNRQAKVSAHVVVRRDGTVIQCVPFNWLRDPASLNKPSTAPIGEAFMVSAGRGLGQGWRR